MTKLFLVSCELSFVVAAEDARAARVSAREHARDELGNLYGDDFSADELRHPAHLPDGWEDDSLPYGGTKTVGEYLAEVGPPEGGAR